MSVHTETTEGLPDEAVAAAVTLLAFTTLSDENCDKQTWTHSILMNFSCLPGIRSVAGQVT